MGTQRCVRACSDCEEFVYIHKRNLVNEAMPFLNVCEEEFYSTVRDSDELEVNLADGVAKLNGKIYLGVPLPEVMRNIIQNDGLVSDVKRALKRKF